jgi:hypothetical protein
MRQKRQKSASPIDARQRALAEEQEKLRQQMAQLQRVIEEAPLVAQENEKLRRQELLARSRERVLRVDSPKSLVDRRYDVSTTAALPRQRRKSRKSEQREARLKFFVLCAVLLFLAIWLYTILQ